MTKEGRRNWVVDRYKRAQCHLVTQYYKSPSALKIAADNRIRHQMVEEHGTRYRIVGGNCDVFQCAYCVKKDDGWYLKYFTKIACTEYKLTDQEVKELYLDV